MQKLLFSKISVVCLIALILLVPLQLISGKISERSAFRDHAKRSVAQSWTGEQQIVGPMIAIPYVVAHREEIRDANGVKVNLRRESKVTYVVADKINIESSLKLDSRFKGIYKIPVYTTALSLNGIVDKKRLRNRLVAIAGHGDSVEIGQPYFSVAISDSRGINTISPLTWLGTEAVFKPGSNLRSNPNGVHAVLPQLRKNGSNKIPFSFELELRGMESIGFVPVGLEARVNATSSWQHPEFSGRFLPVHRSIDASGYHAIWKVSSFASNVIEMVEQCQHGNCAKLLAAGFGVKHIEPVDVYLQAERSVKYGILFIALSFIAFFVFEVMKRLPIHGIQYTLVGFAIAVFYLLLLSLSEHVAFEVAYAIATLCCVGLLQFYLTYVMQGFKQALLFSLFLTLLYIILFVIISAEDYALLMGSLLCFAALVVVMVSTRRIDWYAESHRLIESRREPKLADAEEVQ